MIVSRYWIVKGPKSEKMTHCCQQSDADLYTGNSNNPVNGTLSRTTPVNQYQKTFNHSHPVFVATIQHL